MQRFRSSRAANCGLSSTVIGKAIIGGPAGWSGSTQRGSYVQCLPKRVRKTMPHAKGSSGASRLRSFVHMIGKPSLLLSSSTQWMLTSAVIMKYESNCHLAAAAPSNTAKASALCRETSPSFYPHSWFGTGFPLRFDPCDFSPSEVRGGQQTDGHGTIERDP